MLDGYSSDSGPGNSVPYMEAQEFPPLSSLVDATFGARSRRGRNHAVNEDHYLIIRMGRSQQMLLTSLPQGVIADRYDEHGYAMMLADGIGGAGETASRLALSTLMHLVLHFGKWNLRIINDRVAQEVMGRAARFYRHVDGTVAHHGMSGTTPVPQTTLTATFSAGRDLFFAHVGHSRAYLLRHGALSRLTRDHTIGSQQSAAVPMAPLVNVAARDVEHLLTQTIGMRGSTGPRIDLERFQLDDGDRVLVCSNGLTDAVDEASIARVLASDDAPDDQCEKLVDLALAAGGEDDATALVARYRIPE
jgi:protein phosphatase